MYGDFAVWNGPQRLRKRTGRVENQRKNRNNLDYCIVEIGENTERNPGNLRRLAANQTPVKEQWPTLA